MNDQGMSTDDAVYEALIHGGPMSTLGVAVAIEKGQSSVKGALDRLADQGLVVYSKGMPGGVRMWKAVAIDEAADTYHASRSWLPAGTWRAEPVRTPVSVFDLAVVG